MGTVDDRLDRWIDDLNGDDFIAAVEAARFVDTERHDHPGELDAWLDTHASLIVAIRMREVIRSRRATDLRRHTARTFAAAARDDATPETMSSFLDVRYVVNDDGTQRSLAHMTWLDLDYAAVKYEERSAANAFEAAFLRAVQKRLHTDGSDTVADVLTDEQIDCLRRRAA